MKTALIIRYGAYGDLLIITPVIEYLNHLQFRVIVNVSERGEQMLKNNPNVDEFILYKSNAVPNSELQKHWDDLKEKIKPDLFINFSESLEMVLALHPAQPQYYWSKKEREKWCNKNYYEHSFDHAKLEKPNVFLPEFYPTQEEEESVKKLLKKDKINIVWGLSGSGKNKAYPWVEYVIGEIFKNHKNIHIHTVGDEVCKILEAALTDNENISCHSGEISMRESITLTKFADLVVSPDTGLLHGAGCYDTHKIGLLGHSTIENITKHFKNDHSIESDSRFAECSPCFKLIYDQTKQCPIEASSGGVWCMHHGLDPEVVYNQISKVIKIIEDEK